MWFFVAQYYLADNNKSLHILSNYYHSANVLFKRVQLSGLFILELDTLETIVAIFLFQSMYDFEQTMYVYTMCW